MLRWVKNKQLNITKSIKHTVAFFVTKTINYFFNKLKFIKNINYYIKLILFFFKKYIYTINHKRIALNYLYFSLLSGFVGTFLATLIRFELALPGSHLFKGDSIRYLQVITLHALVMIFFVVIPIFFGFFANFFIPYHIGSKDVAFPRLNSLGFWIIPSSFLLLMKLIILRPQVYKKYDVIDNPFPNLKITKAFYNDSISFYNITNDFQNTTYVYNNSLFYNSTSVWNDTKKTISVKCSSSSQTMAGWTYITPFSSKTDYTGLGALDLSIVGILMLGFSSTLSVTNLLITRRILSIPGLKNRKSILPFLSISLFLVMRMLTLITPVLAAAMIMLLADRHLKTSFFDYAYGGDVVLFNHLFWFFGHPEVYVVIIPAFGIVNMLLPYYAGKLLIAKNHLIWATYVMGYMGFLVWGHHMYLVGLDHKARSLFSTVTIMISLPAVIKIVNWLLTIINGHLLISAPLLFIISFIFFFLSGGLTGLWLSHVSLNIYIHDTFYVVGHFHFMFSSATFSAIFAAIFHYFHIIFNFFYNKRYIYFMWICWNIGQWLTFVPLYWVGYNGLPRRYHDYNETYSLWHGLATHGHIFTLYAIFFFLLTIIESNIIKFSKPISNYMAPRMNKRVNYYSVIKSNRII